MVLILHRTLLLTVNFLVMSTLSIPAFHVSDISKVEGRGEVFIQSRTGGATGTFSMVVNAHFDPATDDYPTGMLSIKVDLSDGAKGVFKATSLELINSYGKHNPTVYITGRCADDIQPNAKGCRFWVIIVDNRGGQTAPNAGTPDIIGFAIHDNNGNRIAYGVGPVKPGSGNFTVMPK